MKKFILISSLLLSSLVHAEPNDTLNQFTGEWTGKGKQSDSSHWSIKVNISPNLYVINYPSLACGGVLNLVKTTDGSLVFKETLTYGIERCIDHGNVVLNKVKENEANYRWFDDQSKIQAVGHLTRKPLSRE